MNTIKNTVQYLGLLFGAFLCGVIPFYVMHILGALK